MKRIFITLATLLSFSLSYADTPDAESFIRNFYQNRCFEDYEFLESHCSVRLLSKLRKAYDYEGDGYAVWLFRSGAQDGPDETRNDIVSIERHGDWYTYEAYDTGILFNRSVKLKERKGSFVIKDVEGFVSVNPEQFAELVESGDYVIIDVRTPEEYAEGHIEGALNIDFKSDEFQKIARKKLKKVSSLAIYCRSGRRSKEAAKVLSRMGFSGYELDKGYLSWTDALCTAKAESIALFNGKDLQGWDFILADNSVPASKVFYVSDGIINIAGQPFGYMYTQKAYSNYILSVEWRWPEEPANSGVFLNIEKHSAPLPTCVEHQLKAGDAGQFLALGGSHIEGVEWVEGVIGRKERIAESSEFEAGQWNKAVITVKDGHITTYVNGVLQNEATDLAKCGPIALQSEGGPIQFRNVILTPLE